MWHVCVFVFVHVCVYMHACICVCLICEPTIYMKKEN